MYELLNAEEIPAHLKKSVAVIGREVIKDKIPQRHRRPTIEQTTNLSKKFIDRTPHNATEYRPDQHIKEAVLPPPLPHEQVEPQQDQAVAEIPQEPAIEPATNIELSPAEIDELLASFTPGQKIESTDELDIEANAVVPEWVASLPEAAAEHVELSTLLSLPLPAPTEVISNIIDQNPEAVPVLPPICSEVCNAIQELAPEPAIIATEKLQAISALVDAVVTARMDNTEIAPKLEQEIAKLCIELFEYLGIQYTPETALEFAIGIAQTKKFMDYLKAESQEWIDKSMREALPGALQTNVVQLLRPFTRQLGSLTLRLTAALAA